MKENQQINAILIDDEVHSLETLRMEIERNCPMINIIALCKGPEEGKKAIKDLQPDLVFLDIQMPGQTGFELLRSLDSIPFEVIFVTAYDEYSMQAIKLSALDYLLKPVDDRELIEAVDKAIAKQQLKQSQEQVSFLLTALSTTHGAQFTKIALPSINGLDFVNISDIIYCEAEGNYTNIYMEDGGKFVISRPLSDFEKMISNPIFFRTHKTFLINLDHIRQYVKGSGGQVIMKNGASIQVSRMRKPVLMELIYQK